MSDAEEPQEPVEDAPEPRTPDVVDWRDIEAKEAEAAQVIPVPRKISDFLDNQLWRALQQAQTNREFYHQMWYQADNTITNESGMAVINTMLTFAVDDPESPEKHWHVSVGLDTMWANEENLVDVAEQAIDFLIEVMKVEKDRRAAEPPEKPEG